MYRRRRNLFKYLDGHTWLLQEGLYTEFYQRRDLREVEYVSQFKGYHTFSPSHGIDKRGIKPFVHSWIALAFYGPCPEGKSVDHINQVKTDKSCHQSPICYSFGTKPQTGH
jgi:hypothetical protein